jgi:hypothetical protein
LITGVGGTTVSTTTNLAGNYLLGGFGPGPYTVTPSRPNENFLMPNGIFSNDATFISQHVVHLITLGPVQQRAGDVSGQGMLSSFDAGLVAQWIVGITNPLNQTGKWKFTPPTTMPDTNADTTQNYLALLMGDVNADWLPPTMAMRPDFAVPVPGSDSVVVSVPDATGGSGSIVSVPLSIENLRGRSLTSYQFDVQYDPAVLTPAEGAVTLDGTMSAGMGVAYNSPEPGLLKVVVYGIQPVSADGVYATLRFVAAGSPGSYSPFDISHFRMDDGLTPVWPQGATIKVTSSVH